MRDGVIGEMPLALLLDRKLADSAKIVASLLWSQSYLLSDGRRVVAWKVQHVASVLGCSFATASTRVRELRDAGWIARIMIPVPEFDQSVRGYWLGCDVREAVRTRNARHRAAKAPACPVDGRSSDATTLVSLEPGLATGAPASPVYDAPLLGLTSGTADAFGQ